MTEVLNKIIDVLEFLNEFENGKLDTQNFIEITRKYMQDILIHEISNVRSIKEFADIVKPFITNILLSEVKNDKELVEYKYYNTSHYMFRNVLKKIFRIDLDIYKVVISVSFECKEFENKIVIGDIELPKQLDAFSQLFKLDREGKVVIFENVEHFISTINNFSNREITCEDIVRELFGKDVVVTNVSFSNSNTSNTS